MRVLFDPGTPAPLRKHLGSHKVSTAYDLGWVVVLSTTSWPRIQKSLPAIVEAIGAIQAEIKRVTVKGISRDVERLAIARKS